MRCPKGHIAFFLTRHRFYFSLLALLGFTISTSLLLPLFYFSNFTLQQALPRSSPSRLRTAPLSRTRQLPWPAAHRVLRSLKSLGTKVSQQRFLPPVRFLFLRGALKARLAGCEGEKANKVLAKCREHFRNVLSIVEKGSETQYFIILLSLLGAARAHVEVARW